jgi:phage shock protein A
LAVSKERLRELLAELGAELNEASDVDADTREQLAKLHDDIERLTGEDSASAVEQARSLESQFAARHPVAERIARELADLLAKMGI